MHLHAVPTMAIVSLNVHAVRGTGVDSHALLPQQNLPTAHSLVIELGLHLHAEPMMAAVSLAVQAHVAGVAVHDESYAS